MPKKSPEQKPKKKNALLAVSGTANKADLNPF